MVRPAPAPAPAPHPARAAAQPRPCRKYDEATTEPTKHYLLRHDGSYSFAMRSRNRLPWMDEADGQ